MYQAQNKCSAHRCLKLQYTCDGWIIFYQAQIFRIKYIQHAQTFRPCGILKLKIFFRPTLLCTPWECTIGMGQFFDAYIECKSVRILEKMVVSCRIFLYNFLRYLTIFLKTNCKNAAINGKFELLLAENVQFSLFQYYILIYCVLLQKYISPGRVYNKMLIE